MFGYYGDRRGRKSTLVASLIIMGVGTMLIGTLPTYDQVGILAPVLLLLLRLTQGFALGGEWSGAALVAVENAPQGKRATFGTFPQLGAPIGFVLANGAFLLLGIVFPSPGPGIFNGNLLAWGWRIPFLLSGILVLLGLWVRLRIAESTAFQSGRKGPVSRLPLADIMRRRIKVVTQATLAIVNSYVLFYIITTFVLAYAQTPRDADVPGLGYETTTFVMSQIGGAVLFAMLTFASGRLADGFGRRRVLLCSNVAASVFGLIWAPLFAMDGIGLGIWIILAFSLMGLIFGPIGAFLAELFPTEVRYTGSAIVVGVAAIIGASITPIIAVALWRFAEGSPVLVGLYLSGTSVISALAIFMMHETGDRELLASE